MQCSLPFNPYFAMLRRFGLHFVVFHFTFSLRHEASDEDAESEDGDIESQPGQTSGTLVHISF